MSASPTAENKQSRLVRDMFGSIAPNYDFLNHLLSFNIDRLWRRHTVRVATRGLAPDARILDVACGTGDLTLELRRAMPRAKVLGLDFTHEMLVIATKKSRRARIRWMEGDALRLPFDDATFDLLTIGFGLRNLERLDEGLRELRRVLRPGGRLAVLEFTQPEPAILCHAFHAMFATALPAVAGMFSRAGAYKYLAESIRAWPNRRALARRMKSNGFGPVRHELLFMRTAALHVGVRR